MATAEDTGLSLSDWVGLISAGLAALAILIGLIGGYFLWAVTHDGPREKWQQRLVQTRWRDSYHDFLRGLLIWLDEKVGPPPFARTNPHDRRAVGVTSLGVCITLSLAYSIGSWLAGWVAGAPGGLGDVTLIEQGELPDWMPAWTPEWLPRLLVALLFVGIGVSFWWYFRTALPWVVQRVERLSGRFGLRGRSGWRAAGDAVFRFFASSVTAAGRVAGAVAIIVAAALAGPGAVAIAGAVAGVVALAVAGAVLGAVAAAVAVVAGALIEAGGAGELGLITLLFWFALPGLNGVLDWISLSISRWFGRWIVAERDSPRSLLWTLGIASADLVFAVTFAFGIAWLLAFGVEASALWFGLSLELEAYVEEAAAAPWTTGFWVTFMVLSTLVPTAVHFVLAIGAVAMAWSGNPLRAWAADKLASGNEADWLGPQLYLTFGWLVPTLLVPAALIWLIAQAVGLIAEPLPDALRDTALDGIATARAWFR